MSLTSQTGWKSLEGISTWVSFYTANNGDPAKENKGKRGGPWWGQVFVE